MSNSTKPNFIVGIGGSAGGLQAYVELLEALPSNTGMAFVFVAHIGPTSPSFLHVILARSTNMPAIQAADGMQAEANHVYVIAPNTNLYMEGPLFRAESPRTIVRGRHHQVDLFLISLANAMGTQAISIILSGADSDGTEGSKFIKAKGGITFAQDLSAQVESMPLNAQESGCIDHVLAPRAISLELTKIVSRFERRQAVPPA